MPGKFVITQGKDKKFYFNLKASNGEVILTSQGYQNRRNCRNGIESVRKNAAQAGRFEAKKAKSGKAFFVLTASNGQTIGKSQMYSDDRGCSNGIASVGRNAASASVVDETT